MVNTDRDREIDEPWIESKDNVDRTKEAIMVSLTKPYNKKELFWWKHSIAEYKFGLV